MSFKYEVITLDGSVPIKAWVNGVPFEEHARAQALNVARLPFIYKHVAIMPDVHAGYGATIGSVIATCGAVIPSAVGVDIGCGMTWAQTTLQRDMLPKDLELVWRNLREAVPNGRTDNGGEHDKGSWQQIPDVVNIAWMELEGGYKQIVNKHPRISHNRVVNQLGTLGTGNHFLEVVVDELDHVGIMLHSGSRGPGAKIGEYFSRLAKEKLERWFVKLPDMMLSYLPERTQEFDDYMAAATWAQRYAEVNRELMLNAAIRALRRMRGVPKFDLAAEPVSCHHNYVTWENHFGKDVLVTRKGAIRARKGDLGIIPGSMGSKSYIVLGLGNPESFMSCSHGAGRSMSRTDARKTFTLKDHRAATEGVVCDKDAGVLDETPGAYKDIDAVMEAQSDLVQVEHTLKQIICVKGSD